MVVIVFLRAYKVEWSQKFLHIHRNTRVIILPITLMRLLTFGECAKVTGDLCSTWCIWLKERKCVRVCVRECVCVCVSECVYAVVCCDRGRKGLTVIDGRDNHPPSALLFFSLLLACCFYIQFIFYISGIFRLTYLTKNVQWVSRLKCIVVLKGILAVRAGRMSLNEDDAYDHPMFAEFQCFFTYRISCTVTHCLSLVV